MPASPEEFQGVLDDLDGMSEGTLRAQIERAHMVAQLTEHPGWPLFCDYLIALTTTLQRKVLNGNCQSLEEYRFETGRVSGMREAIEAPERLMVRVRRMQEQVEQANTPSDDEN